MLFVDEAGCTFADDRSYATIRIGSDLARFPDQIEELRSVAAKNFAISHAAQSGVADPRLNSFSVNPYPVNHQGLPLDHVKDEEGHQLPQTHPDMQPCAYFADIPVCKKLI